MNRDEAKERIEIIAHDESTTWDSHSLIDEIYDDFKERTCETCKFLNEEHGLQPDGMGWQTLECELWDGTFDISPVFGDDFGCNKWEKK